MEFTSLDGEARLMRAGTAATSEGQGELLAVDTPVMVSAGDALFFPTEHGDIATNVGDDALVLLVVNLHTEGEPTLTMMATPTP